MENNMTKYLEIQKIQLDEWKTKLNLETFNKLKKFCEESNLKAISEDSIVRGDDLTEFILNLKSMKQFKVTVYVEVPFETYVEACSEEEAQQIALKREPYIPYLSDDHKEEDFILGDILEFPNLGKNKKPEIEEFQYNNED